MALKDPRKTCLEDSTAHDLNTVKPKSKAARFNLHTLKKLQEAVEQDPEVDLSSKLPIEYSVRLTEMRNSIQEELTRKPLTRPFEDEDIRQFLQHPGVVEVVHPLAEQVVKLLTDCPLVEMTKEELQNALSTMMWRCEILWKSSFPLHKMVFKCGPDIVIKAVRKADDYTEYTTLQYLEKNRPVEPFLHQDRLDYCARTIYRWFLCLIFRERHWEMFGHSWILRKRHQSKTS